MLVGRALVDRRLKGLPFPGHSKERKCYRDGRAKKWSSGVAGGEHGLFLKETSGFKVRTRIQFIIIGCVMGL